VKEIKWLLVKIVAAILSAFFLGLYLGIQDAKGQIYMQQQEIFVEESKMEIQDIKKRQDAGVATPRDTHKLNRLEQRLERIEPTKPKSVVKPKKEKKPWWKLWRK